METIKEECAFIGLGQCGSNISTAFEALGYNNVVINSSERDLMTVNAKHKIKLNARGCSKNRDKAKRAMMDSVDTIVDEILNYIPERIVFVCFSSGGGTGSGISSFILSALAEEGKLCIPIVVIPNEVLESVKACDNTFQCISELEDIEDIGTTMILDNATRDKNTAINADFVNTLDAFLSYDSASKNGNLDEDEKETLLSAKGITVMSKISKDKTTTANLIESLNHTIFAQYEHDRVIMYLGVILSRSDISINDLKKETGEPYDSFVGLGCSYSMMILSGLSMPTTRLDRIKNKVVDNRETIVKTITTLNSTHLSNENLLGDVFATSKPKVAKKGNKMSPRDILMKQMGGEL